MSDPEVSVLLPVYNDEETVGGALESILDQTFDRFEMIVVDDGSTDDSATVIKEYSDDSRVRTTRHEKNRGLPAALNTGLEAADADLIARQDADDRSYAQRLDQQHQYLCDNPSVAVLTTGVDVVNENGIVTESFAPPEDPTTEFDTANPIVHGSVMARKETLLAVDGYDEFFIKCQDYDLWSRLSAAGHDLRGIPETLYRMRRESKSLTVEERKTYATYAALARLPEDRTEELKEAAQEQEIEELISHLCDLERAKINQRLVQANVEHQRRTAAVTSALCGLRAAPFVLRSYAHVVLALAPSRLGRFAVNRISGR